MAQKLFDKASLVMIPSQYKEGKIYNIKPEDQSSSFEFERGSAATRVNSSGLIETLYDEATNLLLQSNQFDTTWTTFNATPTGGELGYDGSSDAWLLNATGASGSLRQDVTLSGVQTFSVYVKKGTADAVEIDCSISGVSAKVDLNDGSEITSGASTINTNIESVGSSWYRISLTGNGSATVWRMYVKHADNSAVGSGDNVYIQDAQLEAGYFATPYIDTTTQTVTRPNRHDTPRLDYSGTEPALLLEPQRTNLITNSENYEASSWEKLNVNITPNNILSPSGKKDGLLLQDDASSGFHRLRTDNITSAGDYTFSLYAKAGTSDKILLYGYLGGGGIGFDLTNKTNFTVPGISSSGVNYGFGETLNGWTRIWIQVTYSINNPFAVFMVNQDGDAVSYSGNGDSIYIYGAQVEQGSYATSYIPTNGQAETRLADVCTGGGDASVFNDSEGTLYYELSAFEDTINRTIQFDDGTTNNYIYVRIGGNGYLYFFITSGGTQVVNRNWSGFEQTDNNKIAVRYSSSGYSVYVNGVERLTGTNSISFANNINQIRFTNFPNKTKMINYFSEALTDTELQQLTSNT